MKDVTQELRDLAARVADRARKAGADAAEVLVRDGSELTAKVRMAKPELVKEAGSRALGLRVFRDRRSALTYTSDFDERSLEQFVRDSVELAQLAEPDELNTLPDAEDRAGAVTDPATLDLFDPATLTVNAASALERAREGEDAARAADARVTNSEGASWSRTAGAMAFATSDGFVGGYRGTFASLVVEPIADDADGKKRNGFEWTASRKLAELRPAAEIGREAARVTCQKLGARKVATQKAPIVFSPEAGRAIIRLIFSCANGSAFYRRASYLLEREGTPIASPLVTLFDDPFLVSGPGSRPFDGDGLPSRRNVLVKAGVLETVLTDVYTARKLGRRSTHSAGRGVGGAPGPTTSNLLLEPGKTSAGEIVGGVKNGFYVTEMMGFGFNPVTGDFSRGAAGRWIENGELTVPVAEVTISANLDALLKGIDAVGDDVDRRSSTMVPTFRVSEMTIAGQ
jgi:PmbA protein